jgi:hypothetical protein
VPVSAEGRSAMSAALVEIQWPSDPDVGAYVAVLNSRELAFQCGIIALALYNNGDGVVRRGSSMLWEKHFMVVKGPLPDSIATECVLEGFLAPTPMWDRVCQKALKQLRRHEQVVYDNNPSRQQPATPVTSVTTIFGLMAAVFSAGEVSRLLPPIALQIVNVVHAVLVVQTMWGDGGEEFRDRASRREAHHQQSEACKELVRMLLIAAEQRDAAAATV